MHKFLKKVFGFGLIIVVINHLFFEISMKSNYIVDYKNVNTNYRSYLLADSHGLPLDTLLQNQGIFNFSAGSESYIDMLRKVDYLINTCEIDRIFITIDDHTLSEYRVKSNNTNRSVLYTYPDDYSGFSDYLFNRYLKLYIFNANTRILLIAYVRSIIRNMFERQSYSWNLLKSGEKKERCEKRFASQFIGEPSGKLSNCLLEIINKCNNNNINLIGIKFPLTNDYINTIGKSNFGADSIFYSLNLDVLDFKKYLSLNDSCFKDQDHLNEYGAELLAKELIQNL